VTLEEREQLARDVFASIDDLPASTVRLFASTLRVGGPVSRFSNAFSYWADVVENPEISDRLAVLKMAHDLRRASLYDDELPVKLANAHTPPWPAILRALLAIRADADD
jgi:hypothetical protein